MMNSFRILLFFLVLSVCSCNQDAERKEEGSLKKNSGKTTNPSRYSVKDVQFYLGESNSMYLGSFDELEVHFGKENLTKVDPSSEFFYDINKNGVLQFLTNSTKQEIYGLSDRGEIIGRFKVGKANASVNQISGDYEVYVDLELISSSGKSIKKSKAFMVTDLPIENSTVRITPERLSSREVNKILGRRVNSSRINQAYRYVTNSGIYILINLYEYHDYSEIFLFQEEDGRYQPLNLERQTDYDASKFRPEKWESYMALGNCVMLPTLFQESPLILAELISYAEDYEIALYRLSDRRNSRSSDRVSSQTYEYESYGDRRMGKEIMRKSVDSQGRITWFYEGEKIGKHRLNREVRDGQEYVYFDSSPSKKYAIEYSRCGFTCRHPSGKTQFYTQVSPSCRD